MFISVHYKEMKPSFKKFTSIYIQYTATVLIYYCYCASEPVFKSRVCTYLTLLFLFEIQNGRKDQENTSVYQPLNSI